MTQAYFASKIDGRVKEFHLVFGQVMQPKKEKLINQLKYFYLIISDKKTIFNVHSNCS